MAKKDLSATSPAESEILALVWKQGKATVQEICEVLPPKRNIAYATVQTLLRRLEKKGYVKHENRGLAHVFYAAVKKEDVIKRSVGDLVNRLFHGDPVPLMLHLAEHDKISEGDIDRLRELAGKTKKKKRRDKR